MLGRAALLGAGCLLTLACGGDRGAPARSLDADRTAPSSLLRLARGGGPVRAYDGASLAPLDWAGEALPPLAALIGSDAEQRQVVVVDASRNLRSFDIGARRAATLAGGTAAATIGPDGTIWAIDTALALAAIGRRNTVRTARALAVPAPRGLYGTLSGRLLVLDRDAPVIHAVGGSRPPADLPIERGAVAATMYGELLAIAADSGIVLHEPDRDRPARFVAVDGRAQAVVFSPSGHRIFVATEDDGIRVLDRFDPEDEVADIPLPGAVSALRMDRDGRWLLARPAGKDSVWVIDVEARKAVASISTGWESDLPAVTTPGRVAVRWQTDVVLVDVAGARPVEAARIEGGAEDFWALLAWSPARPQDAVATPTPVAAADSASEVDSTEAAPDSADVPAGEADPEALGLDLGAAARPVGVIYLQVSSSRNPDWAATLGDQLRQQGLKASVLRPTLPDEPFRVVLGPYPTREAAEEAGRLLGMPSFVITVAAPASAPR